MNKTSEWVTALNQNTETLKETIRNSEAQSTSEIADLLRNASEERLNTIRNVIAEEQREYDRSVKTLFKVKTWQFCVMFFPAIICIVLFAFSLYLKSKIDTQKEQAEYWAKHMGNAEVTTCRWNNDSQTHPCIRVVKGRVYGENGDLMVIKGY